MSIHYTICPNCSSIPSIQILENFLDISVKCNCGYNKVHSIKEYLSKLNNNKPKFSTLCKEHISLYSHYCNDCNLHLCHNCLSSHQLHHIVDLEKGIAINTIRAELANNLNQIETNCGRIKYLIISQFTQQIKELNEAYDKTISLNRSILSFIFMLPP